jgi:hypothetical protein
MDEAVGASARGEFPRVTAPAAIVGVWTMGEDTTNPFG